MVQVNKDCVNIFYTKSQVLCFVNNVLRVDLSMQQIIIHFKKVLKKAKGDIKLVKRKSLSKRLLKLTLHHTRKQLFCCLIYLKTFFQDSASSFIVAINQFSKEDTSKIKSAFNILLNSNFLHNDIKTNPMLQETITNLDSKIDKYLRYLDNIESTTKTFNNLIGGKRGISSEFVICDTCASLHERNKARNLSYDHAVNKKWSYNSPTTMIKLSTCGCNICQHCIEL